MRKQLKRLTAFALVLVMLLSNLLTAFAEEEIEEIAEPQQYTLTVEANTDGIVEVEGNEVVQIDQGTYSITEGSEVIYSVTPNNGYEVSTVMLNGNPVTDGVFLMPYEDSKLQISFQEIITAEQVEENPENETIPDIESGVVETEPQEPESEEHEEENNAMSEPDVFDTEEEKETVSDIGEESQNVSVEEENDVVENDEVVWNHLGCSSYVAASDTVTITVKPMTGEEIAAGYTPWRFDVNHNNMTNLGFCAQKGLGVPNSGTFPCQEILNDRLKAVLLVSSGSPYQDNSWWTNFNAAHWIDIMHGTITYAYSGDRVRYREDGGIGTISYFSTAQADQLASSIYASFDKSVLDQYRMYVGINPDSYYQNVIWLESTGKIELWKKSAIPDITNNNSCYELKGAVYGVYQGSTKVAEMTTDENGYAAVEVPAGNYVIKEITAPKGYALDMNSYNVTVTGGNTATVNVKDYPQSDPVSILLGKVDAETTQNMPQGSAALENAEFTIKYYPVQSQTDPAEMGETPARTWIMRTDERGYSRLDEKYKVSGDDFYKLEGVVTLPLGTVTIQETKAPEGYLLNDEIFVRQITPEGSGDRVDTYNEPTIKEDIIRGDIQIAKYGESNDETGDSDADIKNPLKDIKFHLTSKTTNDVYTIITDEQGIASTTQLGISDRGNLPFDTYIVTEESPYPEYDPIKPFEVTIDTEGKTYYYIVRNDTVDAPISVQKVDAETGKIIPVAGAKFQVLDKNKNVITMTVSHYPTLIEQDTWETDENGGFILPETLEYGEYYLREIEAPEGYLLCKEDIKFVVEKEHHWEEPLTVVCKDVPAKGKIRILKTDEETGEPLRGAEFEVKAAEDIVTPDGTLRAEKGEIVDRNQTNRYGVMESVDLYLGKYIVTEIWQPNGYVMPIKNSWEVELKYKDQVTDLVVEELEITNKPTDITIEKKNEDGNPLEGVIFKVCFEKPEERKLNQKDLEEEKPEFVCETFETDENGQIELKGLGEGVYYVQEIEGLPGYAWDKTEHEIVIDENGYINGNTSGEFTLTVENAKTEITETNVIDVETDSQTIYPKHVKAVDTVSMVHLRKDVTYKLVSELRDVETGLPLREGNSLIGKLVQTEKEFVATDSAMDVEMDVSFDATNFAGRTVVVFERLYEGDVEISTHTDLKDTKQQLRIMNPKLHTTAIDVASGTHEGIAKKDVKIRDNVRYEDIISGEYILKGIVMDQQTGKPLLVNGKQVISEKKVTISEENGTVDMDFTFDASELNKKSIVIYEYLYQEEDLIASHEDINDKDQTVTFKVGSLKPNMPGHRGNGLLTSLKTGDHTEMMPWILLSLFAVGMVITIVGIRHQKKQGSEDKDNE